MSRRAQLRREARGDADLDPGLKAAEQALARVDQGLGLGVVPLTRERFREGERSSRRDTKPDIAAKAARNRAKGKAARQARRKGRNR